MLHFGKIPKEFGQHLARFSKILTKFAKFWKKSANISAIFYETFEIRERCKGMHCVDLGESFQTSIYYLLARCGFDTAENEPCKKFAGNFVLFRYFELSGI